MHRRLLIFSKIVLIAIAHSRASASLTAGVSTPGKPVGVNAGLDLVGSIRLLTGEKNLTCAVLDHFTGFAYFGAATSPAQIIKVRIGNGDELPTRDSSLVLNTGENSVTSAVIDEQRGYAYFSVWESYTSAFIVKVALRDPSNGPPRRVGVLPIATYPALSDFGAGVIDSAGGYAYFQANDLARTGFNRIVKIALGEGDEIPTFIGDALLSEGGIQQAAVIDPSRGFAWYGTATGDSQSRQDFIIAVGLGAGDAPPFSSGRVLLPLEDYQPRASVINPRTGYGLFGTEGGHIIKFGLDTLSVISSPPGSADLLGTAVIDPAGGCSWFAGSSRQKSGFAAIAKIDPGSAADPPKETAFINLPGLTPTCSVIDAAGQYALFGTAGSPGEIFKIALNRSQKNFIAAMNINITQTAQVQDVNFYSHVAGADVRLAIYQDFGGPLLIWQAGPISSYYSNQWIIVPIASGSSASVTLSPGNYWLAWQTSSDMQVASWSSGAQGDSFEASQPFGPFPLDFGAYQPTADRWSMYLDYIPANTGAVDDATLVSQTLPSKLFVGQHARFGVTLFNSGTSTWTNDGNYALEVLDDPCSTISQSVTPSGVCVVPNENYQFIVNLVAPMTVGNCEILLRMKNQTKGSFGSSIFIPFSVRPRPNAAREWEMFE